MSNELVKTALADRSSIKPFQFIPIHSRSRIGCRMMCPACCLSSASCVVLILLARRFLIRLVHPSRPSPRRTCRCFAMSRLAASTRLISSASPARFVLRIDTSFRRACPSRLIRSSCPLSSRRSLRPAYPPRFSCRRAGRSSSRSHFVMRPASRLCVLACRPVFRSPSGNGCGCHRLVPASRCYRSACEVGCFSRRVCAILNAVAMGTSE